MAEICHIESLVAKKVKSDLLGSFSHELRSPLHGILAAVSYPSTPLPSPIYHSFVRRLIETRSHNQRSYLYATDHHQGGVAAGYPPRCLPR